MIAGENNKEGIISPGFERVNRFTALTHVQPRDLYDAENVDLSYGQGKVRTCKGYELHSDASASTGRGLYTHLKSDASVLPIAVGGTTAYYWNGSAWTASDLTALAASTPEFASFLDYVFVANGTDFKSTTNGANWGTSKLTSAPSSVIDVEVYKVRLYALTKTTLYWTSVPDTSLNVTWDTSNQYAQIDPYNGDYNVGMVRLRQRLLIFKNFSTYRFLQTGSLNIDLATISEGVGTPNSQSFAVSADDGVCYFFGTGKDGTRGVYRTDGENFDLVSRPIQDLIDGMTGSTSDVRASITNDKLKVYIGDTVTFDGRTIEKCELQFCTKDNTWQWRSLLHAPVYYNPMKFSSWGHYFITSDSSIYKDEYGYTFAGSAISSRISTNYINSVNVGATSQQREMMVTGQAIGNISVNITDIDSPDNVATASPTTTTFSSYYAKMNSLGRSYRILLSWIQDNVDENNEVTTIETVSMSVAGVNPGG